MSALDNLIQLSLANLILKFLQMALAHSPMEEITVDPKEVLKLLNNLNISGLDGLRAGVV